MTLNILWEHIYLFIIINNYQIYLANEAVNNKINPNVLKSVVLNVNKNNPPEIENTIMKSTTDYKWKNIYLIKYLWSIIHFYFFNLLLFLDVKSKH